MKHRSVLRTPRRLRFQTLGAVGLLALAMAACTPQPPRPTNPAKPTPPQPLPKPKPADTPARAAVRQSVDQATDLFNRGENDLACEQVNQAIQQQEKNPDALSADQRSQLDSYRQACQAN